MVKCVRCVITGRVQGVWFRASTQQQANAMRISGWVRNLADERVEVVACGTQTDLSEFQAWLRRGPDLAIVAEMDCREIATQDFADFEIR